MAEQALDACESSIFAGELEAWIEAAQQGDREALGRALSAVRDYLLLVANEGLEPALRVKGAASDLVQETFLQAQRGVECFRGRTTAEWRGWLRRILLRNMAQARRRFAVNSKRSLTREVADGAQLPLNRRDPFESPSRELVRRELETAVIAGLGRLPDRYREVVLWHHRQQLSFEEIGRRHGISAEAARKRWTRALARLRKELAPDHGT